MPHQAPRAQREVPGADRRQREPGGNMGKSPYCGFYGRTGETGVQAQDWLLWIISADSGCKAGPDCLVLGPR